MTVVVSSRRRLEGLRAYEPVPGTYIFDQLESRRQGRRDTLVGVDGAGVVGNRFASREPRDIDALATINLNPQYVGNHARGAVALYLEDLNRKHVSVCPDPFGGAIVYLYRGRNLVAASADLPRLVVVLQDLGVELTRSWRFGLELMASGNGGVVQAPYRELQALRPFEYCILQRGRLYVETYSAQDGFFVERNYEDAIEKARAELEANIAVATSSGENLVTSHLTGGFDSRLVLAGLMQADVASEVRFYCQGDSVSPDRQIAERLAATFDLLMTEHPGTTVVATPTDIGGQLAWPLAYSHGVLTIGPHSGARHGGAGRILSGGYGGTFRSTYDYRLKPMPLEGVNDGLGLVQGLWPEYLFGSSQRSGLLAEGFVNDFSAGVEELTQWGRGLGVRRDAVADFLYIATRSRYFIAHISKSWSQFTPRFDPLYSPEAVALALQLPLVKRAANIVGFDLMRGLEPRLLTLPFDVPKFTGDLNRWRDVEPVTAWSEATLSGARFDGRKPITAERVDTGILRIPKPTNEDAEKARQMNARAYQIAGWRAVQKELKELVLGLPRSTRKSAFNVKQLDALLSRPANRRVQVRTLFNLFGVLTWYHGAQN